MQLTSCTRPHSIRGQHTIRPASHHVLCGSNKSQNEPRRFRGTLNKPFALLLCEATLGNTMKVLVTCAEAFELEYRIVFFDVYMKYIFDATPSSSSLPSMTQTHYRRYRLFVKLCIIHNALVPLIERLSTKRGAGETLAIFWLNFSVLHSSGPEEVESMISSTNHFIRTSKQLLGYLFFLFNLQQKSTLVELPKVYRVWS